MQSRTGRLHEYALHTHTLGIKHSWLVSPKWIPAATLQPEGKQGNQKEVSTHIKKIGFNSDTACVSTSGWDGDNKLESSTSRGSGDGNSPVKTGTLEGPHCLKVWPASHHQHIPLTSPCACPSRTTTKLVARLALPPWRSVLSNPAWCCHQPCK